MVRDSPSANAGRIGGGGAWLLARRKGRPIGLIGLIRPISPIGQNLMAILQQPRPSAAPQTSLLSAWLYLVLLSWRRQARARQMVWIALGLLAFTTAMTAVATAADLWHRPRFRLVTVGDQ